MFLYHRSGCDRMQRIITIEEFRQYYNQLKQIMALAQYDYDYHSNEDNYHSYYVDAAIELQDVLLSCDLSNIPFDEWENFTILSDKEHYVDFSKTKANIDFSIIHYYGKISASFSFNSWPRSPVARIFPSGVMRIVSGIARTP